MAFLSAKYHQFDYFHQQLGQPDWTGKRLLDFGGNRGNLLLDCDQMAPGDYWCIDVDPHALSDGRRRFPKAHFLHYNRYNHCFNPDGVKDAALPDPGVRFHHIVSYSVFTHTTIEEMKALVPALTALLVPGGTLGFTFIDHTWHNRQNGYGGNNLQWRLDRIRNTENPEAEFDLEALLQRAEPARWCTLVNDRFLYLEDEAQQSHENGGSYHTFFRADFMAELFPGAEICKPVCAEMQHCCVITAP